MRQEGLYALWDITRECNFNCSYCCSPRKKSRFAWISGRRLSEAFGENGKNRVIHISGGEPFLYPGFIEICKELTKEFQIKVNFNLSLNSEVVEFFNSINPSRVELIETSLHIEERERLGKLEDFISNILLLQSREFKVGVKAVLHPALIERFQGDRQYLKLRRIKLFPIGKSESNYNLFYQFLSNLKYMSIRRFLLRIFTFIRRNQDSLRKTL